MNCAVWMLAAGGLTGQGCAEESAEEALALVRRAVAKADESKLAQWAYTITSLADGKKTVERHDPSRERGQRWELRSTNGKAPTEKELKKYAEERRRKGAGFANRRLADLIAKNSLQVESKDAQRIRATFRLNFGDEDTRFVIDKLRGTLTVRRDPLALEAVDVANTERISKPGVLSLSELKVHAEYKTDSTRNDLLLHSCWSKIRGRILLVKSIHMDSEITYSDHRWVGSQPGPTPPSSP
jgi:hypothetical protein